MVDNMESIPYIRKELEMNLYHHQDEEIKELGQLIL